MKVIILIDQRYIYQNGLASRLGFEANQNQLVFSSITKDGICPEVKSSEDFAQSLVLLANTSISAEFLVTLCSSTTDALVFIFYLSEIKRLRNIYSRLATQFSQRQIIYCSQHSDIGVGTRLLERLASCQEDRASCIRSYYPVLEAESLKTLRSDFLRHDSYLHAYERFFLTKQGKLPYLWQCLIDRFPKLPELLEKHHCLNGNEQAKVKLHAQIENYLRP